MRHHSSGPPHKRLTRRRNSPGANAPKVRTVLDVVNKPPPAQLSIDWSSVLIAAMACVSTNSLLDAR